ncbi:MAG: hypothetical protein OXC30_00820 [Alphaproteobacteria bacterium]|nr:hypothetical protein [Alphaproteobacteria bacterium]
MSELKFSNKYIKLVLSKVLDCPYSLFLCIGNTPELCLKKLQEEIHMKKVTIFTYQKSVKLMLK